MTYEAEKWIKKAELNCSAFETGQLPEPNCPELVFCGRSNCGKSTLINTLLGSKKLARVSSTPGRTRALHFFNVRLRDESVIQYVDCPGFGYASVSRKEQKKWEALMSHYFFESGRQIACFLLVDSRRDIRDEEQAFLEFVSDLPCAVIMTKADKLSKNEVNKARSKISKQTELEVLPVTSKDKIGLDKLWMQIEAWKQD